MSFGSRHEVFRPKNESSGFEAYRKSGEDFINGHRKLFATFAEDVSLKFSMADKFQIDYEKGLISLDSKWFFEKGYNKEQILWATFHELSHFRDLVKDKDGLLDSFKYIKEKGEILAEESGMSPELAYQTYHTLFNCLDDIYVNKVVARRASFYESDKLGGKHVQELYKEKLFKDEDFTIEETGGTIPNHLQFAFYLLRKAMLPDQEIVVSDEVRRALDTKIGIENREYTPEEMIQAFMLPKKSRDTKASVRHTYLKKYLEPIYEALIRKDIEDANKPDEPEKNEGGDTKNDKKEDGGDKKEEKDSNGGQESKSDNPQDSNQPKENSQNENKGDSNKTEQGKPGTEGAEDSKQGSTNQEQKNAEFKKWSEIHAEFESNSPDQLDQKEIEKFVEHQDEKKAESAKKKEEESKKPAPKPGNVQAYTDQAWAERNKTQNRDIYRELQSLRAIEESIMPYLNSMTELWQNIIAGVSVEIGYAKDESFASGSELNIDSVVDNIGSIYAGQTSPRIYNRITTKEVTVAKPELIRVRLVIDRSGSMNDNTKQKVLSQSLVLILRSIQQFNEMLDLTRGSTGSKLKVETQVLGFGNHLDEIKKFESDEVRDNEPTLSVLDTLKNSGSHYNASTYDHLALDQVLKTQDEVSIQRIKQGKILDLLFEVTDGGSTRAEQSKEAVDKMSEIGVHARAFQIGEVDASEKRIFNYVWNNDEDNRKGQVVGENIEGLLPALTEALKKQLAGVRI